MNETLVCRLCLYNNNAFFNIFSDRLRESNVQQKILKYLYLEVKEDDQLPKLICVKCLDRLEVFHAFHEEVAQNQTLFVYSTTTTTTSAIILTEDKSLGHQSTEYIKLEHVPATIQIQNIHNLNGQTVDGSTITVIHATPAEVENLFHPTLNESQSPTVVQLSSQQAPLPPPPFDEVNLKLEPSEEHRNDNYKETKNGGGSSKIMTIDDCFAEEDPLAAATVEEVEDDDEPDDDNEDDLSESDASLELESADNAVNDDCGDGESDLSTTTGFPRQIIKDTKLMVRGKALVNLMSQFYRLECELCLEQCDKSRPPFKRLTALCAHYNEVHSIKGYVTCCGAKLIKPRAMAMHMARHLQPEAFKCTKCAKILTCPKILQYHIQNHLPEEQRPLACPKCPRRFSYSSALIAHVISHQPEHERASHICDECGKTFSSPGRLSSHINVAHTRHGHNFVCHVCAKQFSSKGNLVYHLTTHQPRMHQVQCEVKECGKWLKNKLCLRKHMVQHSMVRLNCHICDYSALNRQCLRNHVRVRHSDVKPFTCDVCGKAFKLKNTLRNHMVQHTGVRRFSCPFCARQFASSGNYYSHRKRMHPQELAALKLKQEEEEKALRAVALAGKNSS